VWYLQSCVSANAPIDEVVLSMVPAKLVDANVPTEEVAGCGTCRAIKCLCTSRLGSCGHGIYKAG
jgi:hypothetical protein